MPDYNDDDELDNEPIVRFLSLEEKVIQDFRKGWFEHVRAAGYHVRDGKLFDYDGDEVDTKEPED